MYNDNKVRADDFRVAGHGWMDGWMDAYCGDSFGSAG